MLLLFLKLSSSSIELLTDPELLLLYCESRGAFAGVCEKLLESWFESDLFISVSLSLSEVSYVANLPFLL